MMKELITAVSLAAFPVCAAEYFVSPAGDDGNAGTTAEKPFKTLKRAQEGFKAGDTMTILPGVYPTSKVSG